MAHSRRLEHEPKGHLAYLHDDPLCPDRFQEICAQHGIDTPADRAALFFRLRLATAEFRSIKGCEASKPSAKERRALMMKALKLATALHECLQQLQEVAGEPIRRAEWQLFTEAFRGPPSELERIGALRRLEPPVRFEDGLQQDVECISLQDLPAELRLLDLTLTRALQDLPRDRTRHRTSFAATMWTELMCDALEVKLGWSIRFDEHNPPKTNPIERLLAALMDEIAPAESAAIRSALRNCRSCRRRARNSHNYA